MGKSRAVADHGIMIALALILCYIEALLPAFIPVPGVKVGLANIAVLTALYLYGIRSAALVNIARVIMVFFLFGNSVSFLYSLAGAVLSLTVMALLYASGRFSLMTVSVAGGVFHNVGQLAVASVMAGSASLLWYLAVLWMSGAVFGIVIGTAGGIVVRRLRAAFPGRYVSPASQSVSRASGSSDKGSRVFGNAYLAVFPAVGAFLLLAFFLLSAEGDSVVIERNGELIGTYPLGTEAEIEAEGYGGGINLIVIRDGMVRMEEADCPDGICMRMGPISRSGQTIICAPHRIVVRIESGSGKDALDAVLR